MFTIQYFSDIHVDVLHSIKIYSIIRKIKQNIKSDRCVIAGDIGSPYNLNYLLFLQLLSPLFKQIFIIHGNHEYYNVYKTVLETVEHTKRLLEYNKLDNIYFLDNSYYDVEDTNYRIIGSVLWSEIKNKINLTNDFKEICDHSVENNNKLFEKCKKYLETEIENANKIGKKLIIITHFLPTKELIHQNYLTPMYAKYVENYASDLLYLIKDPVKYWIYGHTHKGGIKEINGISCVCNAIGYEKENKEVNYDMCLTIE